MKRSDFLKTLSALPFGIAAGTAIISTTKKEEPISIVDNGSITVDDNVLINNHPSVKKHLNNELIARCNGKINGVPIYEMELPTTHIKYKNQTLYEVDNKLIRKYKKGQLKGFNIVAKTKNCKQQLNYDLRDDDHSIVTVVLNEISSEIEKQKVKPYKFLLYSISVTDPMINTTTQKQFVGVMYRGAYVHV